MDLNAYCFDGTNACAELCLFQAEQFCGYNEFERKLRKL
jgi:hypothetical protein